ncbi:MAG: NAD(+) synthase [Treponema sp.]|jgi:NAD+ synthase (glutamine-hydrolysing)|nr:NAD(+) synthase [Treponema sp.]
MCIEQYGFFRAAGASLPLRVADPAFNAEAIVDAMREAEERGARLLALPELCVTGYTCADLFHQEVLLRGALDALGTVLAQTRTLSLAAVIGLPLAIENRLFNCAAVIQKGRVLGVVPKTFLPGYGEFYEERWFSPGTALTANTITLNGQDVPIGTKLLFQSDTKKSIVFAVELCEDLWAPAPPSVDLARAGAVLLCNLSASNDLVSKHTYRRDLVRGQSGRLAAGYVYAGAGVGESTTDLVFGGAVLIAENGAILAEGARFSRTRELVIQDIDIDRLVNTRLRLSPFMEGFVREGFRTITFEMSNISRNAKHPNAALCRFVDPHPFVPADPKERDERCEEIFAIQSAGLAGRVERSGSGAAVLGLSGGLDSTLALLVTVKTFDLLGLPREKITALSMPGYGTTSLTRANAAALAKGFKVTFREVDIRAACERHFADLGRSGAQHDTVYENAQARLRTLLLMDTANETGGLVVGTGDLSELALGWCTYNGDHISMYAVNAGVPKTLVKYLVAWAASREADAASREALRSVLETPISPELLPPDAAGNITQKTEEILGPYEVHDFFLYHFFRYGAPPEKLLFLAREAFRGLPSKDAPYTAAQLSRWLDIFVKRFFAAQFKRSCIPDGPKVGAVSLSPRGDWRMPSDAAPAGWGHQKFGLYTSK